LLLLLVTALVVALGILVAVAVVVVVVVVVVAAVVVTVAFITFMQGIYNCKYEANNGSRECNIAATL
jgi:hypothetical protein